MLAYSPFDAPCTSTTDLSFGGIGLNYFIMSYRGCARDDSVSLNILFISSAYFVIASDVFFCKSASFIFSTIFDFSFVSIFVLITMPFRLDCFVLLPMLLHLTTWLLYLNQHRIYPML